MSLSLGSAIRAYNLFAASVCAHVLQYGPPTKKLLEAERGALASICSAPAGAMPTSFVCRLRAFGLPYEAVSLEHMSRATRFRVAHTSTILHSALELFRQARDSDEAMLVHRHSSWMNRSITMTLAKALSNQDNCPLDLSMPKHIQKRAYKHYIDLTWPDGPYKVFGKRMIKWDIRPPIVDDIAKKFKAATRRLPASTCIAFLRSCCNAWLTAKRFGQAAAPCSFGCGAPQGDAIAHLLVCPVVRETALGQFCRHMASWPVNPSLPEAFGVALQEDSFDTCLLWHDLLFQAHNVKRRGGAGSLAQLVATRLRALRRQHSAVAALADRVAATFTEPAGAADAEWS